MIYDQIEIGDVLEWKLMGNQSKMVIVVKSEEVIVYGSGKGKEKKWKTVFYVRGLYSFDEEPEPVDLVDLKNNCKRPEVKPPTSQNEDSESVDYDGSTGYSEPTYERVVEIDYDGSAQDEFYQEPIYVDGDADSKDSSRQDFLQSKTSFSNDGDEPAKKAKNKSQLLTEERAAKNARDKSR
ncbi:MAG: hypothetical protein H7Z37_14225 [Pyrinomonadaceae bacterium]|nr:hypothetical protein [Pyrinomonadaceae bacterium]